MNSDKCNGAGDEGTKCFSDVPKNNTIAIERIQGDLSSITYTDAPGGLSYKYYSRYNMWLDFSTPDEYNQEAKKCLDEKFPEKNVSL